LHIFGALRLRQVDLLGGRTHAFEGLVHHRHATGLCDRNGELRPGKMLPL